MPPDLMGTRQGPAPQALHYSCELAGLVLEDQPIPWNAEAVLIEARLKVRVLYASLHSEFFLRVQGQKVPSEALKVEDDGQHIRVFFRLPAPRRTISVELLHRDNSRGQLILPILTSEDFLKQLTLPQQTLAARLGAETVACQTLVTGQAKELIASALIASPTSLAPLVELGLRFRLLSSFGETLQEGPVKLSSSQLLAKQSLVSVALKAPKGRGDFLAEWSAGTRILTTNKLRVEPRMTLARTMRLSGCRFLVQDANGAIVVTRVLPDRKAGDRIGPCFWVSCRLPGIAAWSDVTIVAHRKDKTTAKFPQKVLITDGPTPITLGTLSASDFDAVSHFELRTGSRSLGQLSLTKAPEASFTSEGGFVQPEAFAWTSQTEEQLQERLGRLLGN